MALLFCTNISKKNIVGCRYNPWMGTTDPIWRAVLRKIPTFFHLMMREINENIQNNKTPIG
jgi:hypothetical protein